MKILWMSDSPTIPTGFGNVTRRVCTGLADRGHHVSILGWVMRGQPTPWQNCMLYPATPWHHGMPYQRGRDTSELLHYLRQIQPDVLIIQGDVWWPRYIIDSSLANFMHTNGIPWILYYPIDSDMGENRLPPSWIRILKNVDLPIAMSRYGHDVTQANGVEADYIPLGVDTKIFQPPIDKDSAKQVFGYEGKFVILSDARNAPRKLLYRTLEIFQRFAADKDDVILHLHCDPDDPGARTPNYYYNLRSDIAFLNLTEKVSLTTELPLEQLAQTHQATSYLVRPHLPLEQLAQIYQAADVHLLASSGEGFGLPTLQAAATGAVPLASDYTASRELVLSHGEAIRVRHFLFDEFGLRRALIDIDDAVSKLEMLYRDRQLLASKAQSSHEFALSYDWEQIISQWEETLLREVPRRRMSLLSSSIASSISLDTSKEESLPDFACEEHKTQESPLHSSNLDGDYHPLVIHYQDVQQDMQRERTLRIPVTLPLAKSKQRLPGYVYVASQCDVPSVLALQRIFPGLKVWSTVQLDFGSLASNDQPFQVKVVQANSVEYRPHLALSTLALDMGNFDPVLPIEAAKLGIPCIGLAQQREQALLWPKLSLEKPDPLMAAKLGRQMLTDQGIATDLCLKARQLLASAPVGSRLELN